MEAFRRAVRRAGGSLALSAGMRPKPILSLALPLGVGVEGLDELCEFELAEKPAEVFAERLAAALPGHMRLLDLHSYEGARRLAARVSGAAYKVVFTASTPGGAGGDTEALDAASVAALSQGARRFAEAPEWAVEETREDRVRVVDVRRYVEEVFVGRDAEGRWAMEFTAEVTPKGTARPELVLKALEQASGLSLSCLHQARASGQIEGRAHETAHHLSDHLETRVAVSGRRRSVEMYRASHRQSLWATSEAGRNVLGMTRLSST
jgi:radical SAM-linked protein